ncbi:MAG: hydroxyphenylacetyl-CoA thioesterase PaaI [Mycobacteriaceae bacterium]
MFDADAASAALGIQLLHAGPGTATATMRIRPDMVNGHGITHGGFVFCLADTAFAVACNSGGVTTVAAGADVAFLASTRVGDELVATATERYRSGRSGLYDVTVRCAEKVVAEFRGRSREIGPRP